MERHGSMSLAELARLARSLCARLAGGGDGSGAAADLLLEARVVSGVLAEELGRIAGEVEGDGAADRQKRERMAG